MKNKAYKKHTQDIMNWDARQDSKNSKLRKKSKRRISKQERKYGIKPFRIHESLDEERC